MFSQIRWPPLWGHHGCGHWINSHRSCFQLLSRLLLNCLQDHFPNDLAAPPIGLRIRYYTENPSSFKQVSSATKLRKQALRLGSLSSQREITIALRHILIITKNLSKLKCPGHNDTCPKELSPRRTCLLQHIIITQGHIRIFMLGGFSKTGCPTRGSFETGFPTLVVQD